MKFTEIFILLLFSSTYIQNVHMYWETCKCQYDTPLVPGADVIVGGFDVTQLATSTERSFKSPIFTLSYDYDRCMYSTLLSSKSSIPQCFKIPDQLAVYDIDISSTVFVEDLAQSSYKHVEQFSDSYTSSVSIGVPDMHASIGYQHELYSTDEIMSSTFQTLGYAYYAQYIYDLILAPAYILTFDPIFNMSLTVLPSQIITEEDNEKYNQFILDYGTSYINIIITGGAMHMNSYVDYYYISTYQSTTTINEMNVGFNAQMFDMNFGYWSNSSEYTTTESYNEHSTNELFCYGGNLQLECGSNEWMLSITSNVATTNLTHIPLWYLVTNDKLKHDTLEQKIKDYITTGKLN